MHTLNITKKGGYAIVQIQRGKVNAINHQVVNEIRSAFSELGQDDSVRGVILTGIPHFFSAGLDVIELYGYDQMQMRQFMSDFGRMHIELVRFPKPLVLCHYRSLPCRGYGHCHCCRLSHHGGGRKITPSV